MPRGLGVNPDARIRAASRLLTLAALAAFLGWLFLPHPLVLLVAVSAALAAFGLFSVDQRRSPIEVGRGFGTDSADRVDDGSNSALSPGVSMAGIHLSFESRSRWGAKR